MVDIHEQHLVQKFATPMHADKHKEVQHIFLTLQGLGLSYFKKQLLVCNATQLHNAMNNLQPSYDKHFASKFKHFL